MRIEQAKTKHNDWCFRATLSDLSKCFPVSPGLMGLICSALFDHSLGSSRGSTESCLAAERSGAHDLHAVRHIRTLHPSSCCSQFLSREAAPLASATVLSAAAAAEVETASQASEPASQPSDEEDQPVPDIYFVSNSLPSLGTGK